MRPEPCLKSIEIYEFSSSPFFILFMWSHLVFEMNDVGENKVSLWEDSPHDCVYAGISIAMQHNNDVSF